MIRFLSAAQLYRGRSEISWCRFINRRVTGIQMAVFSKLSSVAQTTHASLILLYSLLRNCSKLHQCWDKAGVFTFQSMFDYLKEYKPGGICITLHHITVNKPVSKKNQTHDTPSKWPCKQRKQTLFHRVNVFDLLQISFMHLFTWYLFGTLIYKLCYTKNWHNRPLLVSW